MSRSSQSNDGNADLAALRAGGKPALARALAFIEQSGGSETAAALIDEAYLDPRGHVIGLTGPPGVGKSTLIDVLLRKWRASGISVGVIAVDPSSQRSGGAFLGDRVRIRTDPEDDGVFVRSLASRGQLGGLAELAFPSIVLMRAVYDRVIVETVGVGQSEAEIASLADIVAMCVQPGSGDSLQFMKAGIMEIPDIALVTKADSGPLARRALGDLKGALSLASGEDIPCLMLSAVTNEGIDDLLEMLKDFAGGMKSAAFLQRREVQAQEWLRSTMLRRFGEAGLEAAGDSLKLPKGVAPFGHFRVLSNRMKVSLTD
jgi:LAO/AO transport system kinase